MTEQEKASAVADLSGHISFLNFHCSSLHDLVAVLLPDYGVPGVLGPWEEDGRVMTVQRAGTRYGEPSVEVEAWVHSTAVDRKLYHRQFYTTHGPDVLGRDGQETGEETELEVGEKMAELADGEGGYVVQSDGDLLDQQGPSIFSVCHLRF